MSQDSEDRAAWLKRRRADAIQTGTCTTCFARPARPNLRTCETCAERQKQIDRVRPDKHRRRSRPRATTIPAKKLTRLAMAVEALGSGDRLELEAARPRTRAECRDAPRPCPFVACKHHLYLDVNPETGTIKLNFPELEPWDLAESCSLDVAERGAATLEEVGGILNLTRERVRQVEVMGLMKLQGAARRIDGR